MVRRGHCKQLLLIGGGVLSILCYRGVAVAGTEIDYGRRWRIGPGAQGDGLVLRQFCVKKFLHVLCVRSDTRAIN